MNENEMTGDDLLTLLDTPAPIWLVIGVDAIESAVARGNGWCLIYDQGRPSTRRSGIVCRPMAGRYADSNGTTVVVVAEDGTWAYEQIS
jgi:hypothetical protein